MKYLFLSLMLITSSLSFANEELMDSTGRVVSQDADPSAEFEDLHFDSLEMPSKQSKDIELYKNLIEIYASNDLKTKDGYSFTQAEANLLVKYFVALNLDPEVLLSMGFHSSLNIDSIGKKSQAIQLINNIANTRKDMANYLSLGNVKCFFRNYQDPFAVFDDIKLTEDMKRTPLTGIMNGTQEAVIVGKCRGCGLLSLKEFSSAEQQDVYRSACAK